MTSSTTSCDSEFLRGSDNQTSAGEGGNQSEIGRSLSYHSIVDSNKLTKRIDGKKRKAEHIHYSGIVTQDDRDRYNKQQRIYRAERSKNDPNYQQKLRVARERNKVKVNEYQRNYRQRQKEKRVLATQLGHPPPIKTSKPSVVFKVLTNKQKDARNRTKRLYYAKNSVTIGQKQKVRYHLKTRSKKEKRKQKIARENSDFEKLKSSERLLLDAFKQEAQKVSPTLSNDVLRRFLRHLSSQKNYFPTGNSAAFEQPPSTNDLLVGAIPLTSNKEPPVDETGIDEKRDVSRNNKIDNHIIKLLRETILLSERPFLEVCTKSWDSPLKSLPNCISSSTQQCFQFKLDNNLLNPKNTDKAFCVLDELSWTPVTTTVHKQKSQKIRITREEFDRLVVPCLNDTLMDFIFQYLLRGASQVDRIYGSIGCSLYHELNKKGRTRMSEQQNILDNELIFWPLQINDYHWVLAVLLQPKLVAKDGDMKQGKSCVLYFDPLNKYLSTEREIVSEGMRDRKKVHEQLLLWLNFELGGDNGSVYDCNSFPLIYEFGDGEQIIFETNIADIMNDAYIYLLCMSYILCTTYYL